MVKDTKQVKERKDDQSGGNIDDVCHRTRCRADEPYGLLSVLGAQYRGRRCFAHKIVLQAFAYNQALNKVKGSCNSVNSGLISFSRHKNTMSQTLTVEVDEVRRKFRQARQAYKDVLPKVDPALIDDFLERIDATGKETLFYTIEVFTKEGTNSEAARQYIMEKTGMVPAIFDKGTHYVTNQKLTLEILKEISDSPDVVEVRGSFCDGVGMRGAYFERRW